MIADVDPTEYTAESLRDRYERSIREAIETAGIDDAATASTLERGTIERVAAGEDVDLTLTEATDLLAAADGADADALAADARERLLLSMSTAVLDVDALSRRLDGEHPPKELQQKLEGRHPMTLAEYARIRAAIAEES